MNHPHRSTQRPHASRNPAPGEIRQAREQAGITQREAAALLHTTIRAYQQWEAGDRRMHPGLWELLQIKLARLAVTS